MPRFARRWHGKSLGGGRRLKLSPNTLRRLWDAWLLGGESPAVFYYHFQPGKPSMPAPVMIRLAAWCAGHRHKSLRAACLAFGALPRNHKLVADVVYWAACRYVTVATFKAMQGQQAALVASQAELCRLRVAAVASIRAHLPKRRTARRIKGGNL